MSSSSNYSLPPSRSHLGSNNTQPLREGTSMNRLRYSSPRQVYQQGVYINDTSTHSIVNSFSLTPVRSAASQRLMAAPPKRKRRISKVPFKVLDAPQLQDDFYLNLVDWSSQNTLAVALGQCVYLWSACTSKVTKLCDLSSTDDTVTSVSWAQRGTHLAVGTNRGEVQLWDTVKCKKVRSMAGHTARVGTLAWTGPILASGSRDRLIYLRDVRVQAPFTDKLCNHKQEVCGLKWSFDEPAFLASGGNDNHLYVIDSRNPNAPVHRFSEHTAAVKAIAWSPHQHGLLASGGGTADRCIRFWNTLSGAHLNKVDTGSQVCNLAWSQNCNEIVSTHGYSLHQIIVWRYPNMSKVTTLTGHTYRVLYLAMSPDGSTVVTGAGDETLRFWQVFPGPRSDGKDNVGGLLFPNTPGSVIR
jgi:cell division cycle 20-like protein 1, cofactor of APC complex